MTREGNIEVTYPLPHDSVGHPAASFHSLYPNPPAATGPRGTLQQQ